MTPTGKNNIKSLSAVPTSSNVNSSTPSSGRQMIPRTKPLLVWQVVAPPHVDQIEFWNVLLGHSQLQLERKAVLFILDMPMFPSALRLLARTATKHWKVLFTFSEMDRLKAWKTLVTRGAPPTVDVIVMDHVILSMFTWDLITQLELKSPRLESIVFRTVRELPIFTHAPSRISDDSMNVTKHASSGDEGPTPLRHPHHNVLVVTPRARS